MGAGNPFESIMATSATESSSGPRPTILSWLQAEPEDDCFLDLAELRQHFGAWRDASDSGDEVGMLELFDARMLDIAGRFKPQLLTASLPVPRSLQVAAETLSECLLELARRCNAMALRAGTGAEAVVQAVQLRARALRLLAEAYLIACMRGSDAVQGLWGLANAVLERLERDLAEADDDRLLHVAAPGVLNFKRLAAISALQPESLTAREQAWVFDYLELTAGASELSARPIHPEATAFWFELADDAAPTACVRRLAPAHRPVRYFSAFGISKRITEQIEWLERRISEAEVVGLERDVDLLDPDVSGLPLGLTPVEVLALLNRLRERWVTPPSREHTRRPHLYSVQVCLGLKNIWAVNRGQPVPDAIVEWMVCNESPGGYGILSVAANKAVLSAGMVLALRRDAKESWSICVVRWVRNHDEDQIELGLQLVGASCVPVSIAFRGSELRVTTPALMLPPQPGTRGNSAILAPAGTYTSRRFVLVREGGQLYIAQGRVLSLDMQTASVELFQYEVDPFPI